MNSYGLAWIVTSREKNVKQALGSREMFVTNLPVVFALVNNSSRLSVSPEEDIDYLSGTLPSIPFIQNNNINPNQILCVLMLSYP